MSTKEEIERFSIEELCEFLRKRNIVCAATLQNLESNRIDGLSFFELSDDDLAELAPPSGDRKAIRRTINSYLPAAVEKVICHNRCYYYTMMFVSPSQNHASASRQTSQDVLHSWIDSVLPTKFSKRTSHALQTNVVTKAARIEIVENLAYRLYAITEYPTPAEYTEVSRELVSRYPVLSDTIGNGFVSSVFACHE